MASSTDCDTSLYPLQSTHHIPISSNLVDSFMGHIVVLSVCLAMTVLRMETQGVHGKVDLPSVDCSASICIKEVEDLADLQSLVTVLKVKGSSAGTFRKAQ